MSFKEIDEILKYNIDIEYKKFNQRLLPGIENIQGIRIPILRKISKEIYLNYDYRNFLKEYDEVYFENIMLKGFVIGNMNTKNDCLDEILDYIEEFIPKIDNWSICDSFCSSLKITKKHKKEMLLLVKEQVNMESEYQVRFALVMLLLYYVEESYLDEIFIIINNIDKSKKYYYIEMAIAWLLTEVYIKYPEYLIERIMDVRINDSIITKFIRKVKDSYKISDENTKELVYHISKR